MPSRSENLLHSCIAFVLSVTLWGQGIPQRIVSQTVGTDEMLIDLVEPHRIAALSFLSTDPAYSDVAQEARAFPQLKNGSAEQIIKFKPDLVLFSSYSRPELVEQVRRTGIPILIFDRFDSLDDVYRNLRMLGKILHREAQAEKIIQQTRQTLTQLQQRLLGVPSIRVLAPSISGYLSGSQTTFQDICDHLGIVNVAAEAGLKGHASTPSESILRWRVDCLILSDSNPQRQLLALQSSSPFKYLPSVKEGRYVTLPSALLSSVTHRRTRGFEILAQQLYPEKFK